MLRRKIANVNHYFSFDKKGGKPKSTTETIHTDFFRKFVKDTDMPGPGKVADRLVC